MLVMSKTTAANSELSGGKKKKRRKNKNIALKELWPRNFASALSEHSALKFASSSQPLLLILCLCSCSLFPGSPTSRIWTPVAPLLKGKRLVALNADSKTASCLSRNIPPAGKILISVSNTSLYSSSYVTSFVLYNVSS